MPRPPRTPEPPRVLVHLLRRAVGNADVLETILGDLAEDRGLELPDGARRWRIALWYARAILPMVVGFALASRRRSPAGGGLRTGGLPREEGGTMETVGRDVAWAARRLRRSPGFTLVAVLMLALGVGGTTTLFTLVNNVVLRPLPFDEPDRLVGVWMTSPEVAWLNLSPGAYFTFRDQSRTFEDIALWDDGPASVVVGQEAEQVSALTVTDGLFDVLRVTPAVGRGISPRDDRPGAPPTVVLGYEFWRDRFGEDASAVGSAITVNGVRSEIVGVAPRDLRVGRFHPAILLPAGFDPSRAGMSDFSYQGIARLRQGVTLEQASEDVARMIPLVAERSSIGMSPRQVEEAHIGPRLRTLREELVGDVKTPLWFLLAATGLVLAIASANVANLLLVRAEGRQREVAVRSALGASRDAIIRQFLVESILLGMGGAVGGVAVAAAGLEASRSVLPQEFPRLEAVGMEPASVLFAVGISLVLSVLFGILPALRAGRTDVARRLKAAAPSAGTAREGLLVRNGLVVVQVGLTLMLVVGSGLMVRSYATLKALDPGFHLPEDVLTVRVNITPGEMPTAREVAAYYETVIRRLTDLPGVTAASGSNNLPMDGATSNQELELQGRPVGPGQNLPNARVKWVAGDYFGTLGIPLRAGRAITWDDIHDVAPVVVVNEAYARRHWGNAAGAVGKRLRYGAAPWREVVGVVTDVYDDGFDVDPVPTVYWPLVVDEFWGARPWVPRWFAFAVRAPGYDAARLVSDVRSVARSVDPDIPLFSVRPMDRILRLSTARTTLTLSLLGLAAAVALALACVGIYAVIAYSVSRSTREIGIRLALGADAGTVRRMVLGSGLAVAATGVVLGLAGSLALSGLMAPLLLGVARLDPATYIAASVGTLSVALAATYVPALRASRLDPRSAMRAD